MIKKTIEYTQFDGEKVSEDFYFHLTEYECFVINIYDELDAVMKSKDPGRIIPALHRIVRSAVGYKQADDFKKSDSYADKFMASDAFSKLMMSLLRADNPERTTALFIKGIMPPELLDIVDADGKPAESEDLEPYES